MLNNLMADILRLRQIGANPTMAAQQLAQRYPQFRQAMPYLQGKSPQQMDATGCNFARSMGVDPMQIMSQFMSGKR